MSLALYQPDNPQNVGSAVRLAACLGMPLHIIEPCGFAFDDKRLKRVAMDYYDHAEILRHASWDDFLHKTAAHRRLLITNQHPTASYTSFTYTQADILILGQESCGFPPAVLQAVPDHLIIPMAEGVRSLNVTLAAAMAAGEMQRQLNHAQNGSLSHWERGGVRA